MIEHSIKPIAPDAHIKLILNEYTGARLISFAVLSERFSFWGLQATMVLFLIQVFSETEKNAFALVGTFGALSYALSLLGGLLSDKLFGAWKSCTLGLFFCLFGNIILTFSNGMTSLNAGLSCVLVGAGLFSPNSNTMLRILYENKPSLKESSFLMMCVAGNISGMLAPLIFGLFATKSLWHYAFFISSLLNGIALLFFFKYSHYMRTNDTQAYLNKHIYLRQLALLFFIALSFLLLFYHHWLNTILLSASLPFGYLIFRLYHQLTQEEKKRMYFVFF